MNSDKKTVLLLYPKTGINPLRPQPPLSLLALGPAIRGAGLAPVIIDQRVEPDYAGKVRALLPQSLFVGITSMTGEQLRYAIDLIALVKELSPATPVVFGGTHATLLPEQAIEAEGVDIVVAGEGEGAIAEIAACLQGKGELDHVRGIYFKRGNQVVSTPARDLPEIDNLPAPAWDLIDTGTYTDFTIQAGRGCPYRCTYCYNMKINGGRWRARSPEAIVEEMKYLYFAKGVTDFFFVDDNFFSRFDRVQAICDLIVRSGLRIGWKATCRADCFKRFTPPFIDLLKRSGVAQLFVGGESGSPAILERISKKITVEDIVSTVEVSRDHGLPTSIAFMTGFPFETDRDRELTFRLMDRLRAIHPAISLDGVNIYTPYPGNGMYEESKQYGLVEPASLSEWSTYVFNLGNLPWFTRAQSRMLENVSFITRFCFWQEAIRGRFLKGWYYPFYVVLRLSALARWKLRAFHAAWEWDVFRLLRRNL
ncbi:B12-binding domain-containing radical SAM protein [Geobacter sp.]|uniref:B12-binding domain-containing radical SAM protein n=1 Tax=Geobacter sp. TaxID=46610 RepID=UPI0027BA87FC|nr:radical SAM protein [Geobacter sp.]